MPSVRASCCPLPLATPSGERVNHQSSVTLLCLNYKWGLFSIIKQICHASVGKKPSVRASCCPLPLATPSGERVNHQSSVTLLCLNYKWGLFSIIKQICHASRGNMMESFPEGGWFSLGLRPRENHPPSGKHSIDVTDPLAWHICIIKPGLKWH